MLAAAAVRICAPSASSRKEVPSQRHVGRAGRERGRPLGPHCADTPWGGVLETFGGFLPTPAPSSAPSELSCYTASQKQPGRTP